MNLCHDIALALSYLHSIKIYNVLLIAGSRAKETDFGMVKLYNVNHSTAHLTPLTLCPGTMAYMSPEALRDWPIYNEKLDTFSLSVLCVQIITRQFPDPGDRFNTIEIDDPRTPSGRVQVEVPEIERRQFHIDLIDPAHPLLPVALECQLKRQQIAGLRTLLTATNDQLQTFQEQLTAKDEQLLGKDEQLAGKDHQLEQKEAAITTNQQEIQQLRQQLQSSEQVTAEFQQNLLGKTIQDQQRQIQELQRQQRQRGGQLRWRDGGRAPFVMYGQAVTVDENVVYVQPGEYKQRRAFSYSFANKKWSELSECPTYGVSLAIVNNLLTAIVGNVPIGEVTNSLFSLTDNKWTEQFPPMPSKRWLTAVVCSGSSLVVAGGSTGYKKPKLSTVEVVCRVGEHQHQLAHWCSPCENFHTYIHM